MIQVAAGVIVKDGKCLITRRSPGQNLAGRWEFPGGKLEAGESPQECLCRELREELDIEVQVGLFIASSYHEYPGGSIQLKAYHVVWLGGELTLSVHDNFAWVTSTEFANYDFAPADIPILEVLSKGGWGC